MEDYDYFSNDTENFFDYINGESSFYLEDLDSLKEPWTVNDGHFLPTILVYGLTFVIGLTGNILVVYAVVCSRKIRSITASFMISLAVADILFLIVCVPYNTIEFVKLEWQLGPSMCKISNFTEMLSAFSSILNLSAISVERFIVIVLPMKSRSWCTSGNTHKILATVWIASIVLSSPAFYVMKMGYRKFHNNHTSVTLKFCNDESVPKEIRTLFSFYKLILMFTVPTAIMIICYTGVIYALWISSAQLSKLTSVPREQGSCRMSRQLVRYSSVYSNGTSTAPCCKHHSGSSRHNHSLNARKQIIKMLIAVVVVFLLCWGPKVIFDVIRKMTPESLFFEEAFTIQVVIECLPYIQSCLNPFVYCFMSKKFRESVRASCRKTNPACHVRACFCHLGVPENDRSQQYELESKVSQGTGQSRVTINRPSTSRSASSTEDQFTSDIKKNQVF